MHVHPRLDQNGEKRGLNLMHGFKTLSSSKSGRYNTLGSFESNKVANFITTIRSNSTKGPTYSNFIDLRAMNHKDGALKTYNRA